MAPRAARAPTASASERNDADFQMVAENSSDILWRIRPDFTASYVSPSVFQILGYTPEDLIGGGPAAHVLPEDLPIIHAAAARQLNGEDIITRVRIRCKDGHVVWVESNARTVRDPETGAPGDTVLVMRDITERKAQEDRLTALAFTDALTGLANRRAFDEALEQEWRRTLRERSQMSLLLIDVDQFKAFNDQYGHQVGDDCLRAVAAAVKGALRPPGDIAARYGGEEIAVILPDTEAAGAIAMAERVRAAIEALRLPHRGNPDGSGFVTASVGTATALSRVGGRITMPEALLIAADSALYKAKQAGRNRVANALLLAPDESSLVPDLPSAAQSAAKAL